MNAEKERLREAEQKSIPWMNRVSAKAPPRYDRSSRVLSMAIWFSVIHTTSSMSKNMWMKNSANA